MVLQDAEQAIRRGHIPAIANYTTYVKVGGARQTDRRTQITDKSGQAETDNNAVKSAAGRSGKPFTIGTAGENTASPLT